MDLSFPLKGGTYYIGGGGNSRWINNHNAFPPQDFALDILRLNSMGNRAWGIWPSELSAYTIYGDSVYSPCSEEIILAVDGFPDLTPPTRDSENPAGNHVVVSCKGVEALLAHLMAGSVAVSKNDTVDAGDIIGRVGNSGNTTQPHLHLHLERNGPPGKILNGDGVPATFNNRFLVRNSVFWGIGNENSLFRTHPGDK
ncbi:MAG: M23 family metallopeptidase [Balneolaceae bacterium]|nr:M23 family metallopeptidase [Balneolaceae bacterium]